MIDKADLKPNANSSLLLIVCGVGEIDTVLSTFDTEQ